MSQPADSEAPGNRTKLADAEQTRNRTEILNQFFRGMLLLNGGACVALLAFLQAIWGNVSPSFVRTLVVCMAFLLTGLVFSALGQFARYKISLHLQFGPARRGRRWQRHYNWLVTLSFLAFVAGAVVILGGLWSVAEHLSPAPH
jgi:hypothetical protein